MIKLWKYIDYVNLNSFNRVVILTKCLGKNTISCNSYCNFSALSHSSKMKFILRPLSKTHFPMLGLSQYRLIDITKNLYLLERRNVFREYHVGIWNFRNDSNEMPHNIWNIKTHRKTSIPQYLVSGHCSQPYLYPYRNQQLKIRNKMKNLGFESSEKFRKTTLEIIKTKDKMKEKMEEIIQRENILTVPNILCMARICLTPVLGVLVLHHYYEPALGIFIFAGVTDLLDGMIARQFPSQQSMLGSFLDPMADKFLVCSLFLALTVAEMIPIPLTMLIVTRDLCLLSAGFYIRYLSLPPPKTLSRYFDVTHATAKLSPTFLSKINTSVQLSLVAFTLAAPVFPVVNNSPLHFLWYITAGTTISSGLSYIFSNDTFHLLTKNRKDLKKAAIMQSSSKNMRN